MTSVDLNALDDSNSTLAERVALFTRYFSAAESQYQMPPGLLLQQGIAESRLIPTAQSAEGAVGIMQMLPRYYPNAGVDALADIESAAQVDAGYYRRFGDWALALAAYNAGPTTVANAGNRVPAIAETRNYVSKILGPLGLTPSSTLFA